jgi:lysyl-tRNA synthetase class I
LLKIVTVNVLESNYDHKVSYEMANVVKDSGEGWFFSMQVGARKHRKKLSWSHWQARWVSGFFT